MNLHEYQAKQLFAEYGIPVSRGIPARTAEDAAKAAEEIGGASWVVKAQVHAGGRGKAGGVKVVDSPAKVREAASKMLGERLVTHQTGPEGLPISIVYVEAGSSIERELYLSLLVDRSRERIVVMASAAGGMDIEEVAAKTPEKILTVFVHPAAGLQPYQARQLAFGLELEGDQVGQFTKLLLSLYKLFVERDCGLLEVNPLIVNGEGKLHRAGRQDRHRGERAVPPVAADGVARPVAGRRDGEPRLRARPELRVAGTARSPAW
jgi:succinyl-CoA synthetase beta subunit